MVPTEAIGNGRLDHSVLPKISIEKAASLGRHVLKPGDILFARRGVQATGKAAMIRAHESGFICGTGAIRLRVKSKSGKLDPVFLACLLNDQTSIDWFKFHAIGATMPNLNEGIIKSFNFALPPLPEQRVIAATLAALDDKIELNRKMNATLEAMARALFRDWFVDFGPTRAKMEGRASYLSPDLWSLFPDSLDDEGKPEGWEVRQIGDFAELKGGKQLEKEHIADAGPVPVFGGAGLMGYTTNHNADGFGISVGRVGAYCGQFFSHRGKAWINNNASLIRPNAGVSGEWLLIALRHIDMDVIKKGAAQPFVSNGDIAKVGIVWPGDAIISAFSDALVSLMRKAEANEGESRTLAQTRDLLLPRLMSGELRVAELNAAEKETTA